MSKRKYKIIIICTALGLGAWLLDHIFDYYFFYKNINFWDLLLFNVPPHEIFIRTSILAIFVVFGFYLNSYIDKIEEGKMQLWEKETQFSQVAANMRYVFWVYKPDSNQVVYVNPAYERIWKRSPENLDKNPNDWIEAIHPEDRAEVARKTQKSFDTKEPSVIEYRILQPDGTIRWILDQFFPIRNHQEEVCYLAGFAEDITARKGAEEALLKVKDELEKQVVERTSDLTSAYQKLLHEIEERRRAEQEVQDSAERLRTLTFQIMNAEESERRRISVILHDDVGQDLIYLRYRITHELGKLRKDKKGRVDCEDLFQKVDGIISKVRQLSHHLSPTILEELGLTAAIRFLFEEFCKHYECACEISAETDKVCGLPSPAPNCRLLVAEEIDGLLSHQAEVNVYRILQESLTNVSKHSEASRITLTVKKQDSNILFTVEDDGKGFDAHQAKVDGSTLKGIGIVSMQERVRMLGGSLAIESREGSGTKVSFIIPIGGSE